MFKNRIGSHRAWAGMQGSPKARTVRNSRRGPTRLIEPLEPRTLLSAAVLAAASALQPAAGAAPTITSANNDTLVAGVGGSFTVLTQGAPTASLQETGALPTGVTFTDNADGTATFTVTPAAASALIDVTLTASNGQTPDATQAFALTLVQPNNLTIINLNDSGPGSLRAAITQANLAGGLDLIKPEAGVTGTINIKSPLPDLAADIIIMGSGLTISGAHSVGTVLTVDAGFSCEFHNLALTGGSGVDGGGIDNEGTLAIYASTITGNTASDHGGGIFNGSAAILTITDTNVTQNTGAEGGGGVFSAGGTLIAIDSTFAKNSAGTDFNSDGGGGIAIQGDSGILTVTNCTIAFNSGLFAGGISDENAVMNLTDDTIDQNKTISDDGGVVVSVTGASAVIDGTIIAKNSAPDLQSFGNTIIVGSNDLIGDGSDADPNINAHCTLLNSLRGTATHPLDPKLGPLASNGGPTPTQAELPGAPGIGKGADFPVLDATNADITKTDQRGAIRPRSGGEDIGAFQLPPTYAATKLIFLPVAKSMIAGHSSFTVELVNAKGQVDTTNTSTVTIAIATGPSGATIADSVQAVAGVATFSGALANIAGSYVLKATDGELTAGKSSKFTVTPDASSAGLVISGIPLATTVGTPLTPSLVVKVEDQFGNVVTTDDSTVTISLLSNPGNATLSGTTIVTAKKGVATFSNVILSQAAVGYEFELTDNSLPAGNTQTTFMQQIALALPIIPVPHVAKSYPAGGTITLSTTFKSSAPASIPFTGQATVVDQNGDPLGTATVNANGSITFSLTNVAVGTNTCTINYPGDSNHTRANSLAFKLKVT